MRTIILRAVAALWLVSGCYSQTNLLLNPNADSGSKDWLFRGDAKIESTEKTGAYFVIRDRGSFYQDIKLDEKVAGKYALLIGRGSSERINADGTITGLPYLYGYLFDDPKSRINTYLTKQTLLGSPHTADEWVTMYSIFQIPAGTVAARIFLNQAERKDVPQNGSAARFDDLGFFVFDTEKDAMEFASGYPQ